MAASIVYRFGKQSVTIPAGESIAILSRGSVKVWQTTTDNNLPAVESYLQDIAANTETVLGPYASGTILGLESISDEVLYEVGSDPIVTQYVAEGGYIDGAAYTAVNATATLTVADLLGQVITSTTAAAVTATLPTGTLMDAAGQFDVGQYFDFYVINTGGTNSFTVAAGTGFTVTGLGSMVVANSTSAHFRVLKTAANTFTCARLG